MPLRPPLSARASLRGMLCVAGLLAVATSCETMQAINALQAKLQGELGSAVSVMFGTNGRLAITVVPADTLKLDDAARQALALRVAREAYHDFAERDQVSAVTIAFIHRETDGMITRTTTLGAYGWAAAELSDGPRASVVPTSDGR